MNNLPIIFPPHAQEAMRKRGTEKDEVEKVIRTGEWTSARKERYEAKLDFPFNAQWNGRTYQTKQINPVFIVENNAVVVITVYVFYFT